jgi:hypothetical protein
MALNGIYRFLYYYLIKKIHVKDVPSGLEDDVFDLPGVELGKYALQLPPPVDSDADGAPSSKHLNNSRDDLSRQAFEMQPLEKQPLMQEMSVRLEGVEFQLNDSNVRFSSRFNEIETKIEGILQALNIGLPKVRDAGQTIESQSSVASAPSLTPAIHTISVSGEVPMLQPALYYNAPNLVAALGQRPANPISAEPALSHTPTAHDVPAHGEVTRIQPTHNLSKPVIPVNLSIESQRSVAPPPSITPEMHTVPVDGEVPGIEPTFSYHPPNLVAAHEQALGYPIGAGPAHSTATEPNDIHADGVAQKNRKKSDLPNILLDTIEFACSL